jgi:DNA-binding transcriptional ArsR family regulator
MSTTAAWPPVKRRGGRRRNHPDQPAAQHIEALADTFGVMGDPTRLRIIHALSRGEMRVGDLAYHIGISPSAVSHQLRLLRAYRLVGHRRDGRAAYYHLQDEHILGLFERALDHVKETLP